MKILLVVQREPGTDDAVWVVDACDEYTLDEWNGELPTPMQQKIDADPANVRTLYVEVADGALQRAFTVPTVPGRVSS